MKRHLYSFILKTKRGEFGGLGHAGARLREIGRPHFEVTKSADQSSLDDHLAEIASEIKKHWSLEDDFCIDLFDVPLGWRTSTGLHPLTDLANRLKTGQLFPVRLIPTTGLENERDSDYVDAAKKIAQEFGCGLCLRLKPEEIDHFEESTELAISLLQNFASDCDLMLDFRSILNQDVDRLATRGVRMVRAMEENGLRFREIIVCSSNIPEKLSEQVEKESTWNQPRTEWTLWERIAIGLGRANVVYGDYCVIFPEFFGPQKNKFINAKLRISDRNHYRLYRGRELYTDGGDPLQYRELAGEVLKIDGIRAIQSKAISEFQDLALGRDRKKGSPGSLVPTEICLHLDVTAEEVSKRVEILAGTATVANA